MTNEKPKSHKEGLYSITARTLTAIASSRTTDTIEYLVMIEKELDSAHAQGLATAQAALAEAERAIEAVKAQCDRPYPVQMDRHVAGMLDTALHTTRTARGGGA